MTDGQWRVFALLCVVLGIEVATSQNTRTALGALVKLDWGGFAQASEGAPQMLFGFGIGGLVLVGLAAWQEGLATSLVILLLILVLINRSDAIAPAVTAAGDAIRTATGQGGSSASGKDSKK